MDARQFDRLTRALGASGSRRSALAALLIGLAAPFLPAAALDAEGRKGKAKDKRSRNGGQGKGNSRGRNPDNVPAQVSADVAAETQGSPASADIAAIEPDDGGDPNPESEIPAASVTQSESKHGVTKRRRGKNKGNGNRSGRGRQRNAQRLQTEAACYPGKTCALGPGKNLTGCDFSHSTTLKGKNLKGANLSQSSLLAADAGGANLSGANLGSSCLVDANLRGANLRATNQGGAIFCRTTMTNGSLNNAGCARGTPCCPTCDSAHPCVSGQVCCGGRCVPGNCCTDAHCSDPARPICVTNTCAPCTGNGQCGNGKVCCGGRCQTGNCCQASDCGASGNTCDIFTCHCGASNRCGSATPLCCGQGAGATCRECCENGQCPCPGCAQNETRCSAQGQCVQCEDASTCPAPERPDCQDAMCNAQGQCGVRNKGDGTTCNDGNLCTLGDTCQSGRCTPGTPKDCPGATCQRGVCNPANGGCGLEPLDNTPCNDGILCTLDDTCRNGECRPGREKACPGTDCQTGVCNPASGACGLQSVQDGTLCAFDGPGGVCLNGSCVACRTETDCGETGNPCTVYQCDGNQCVELRLDDGVACETDRGEGVCCARNCAVGDVCCDDSQCRTAAAPHCDGGRCVQCVAETDCPDPGSCHDRHCQNGGCTSTPKNDGASCPDGVCCSGSCRNGAICCGAAQCANHPDGPLCCGDGRCHRCCGDDASTCPDPGACHDRRCQNNTCSPRPKADGAVCPDGVCCTGACATGRECCGDDQCLDHPTGDICCGDGQCQECCGNDASTCAPRTCRQAVCQGGACDYLLQSGGSCSLPGGGAGICCNGECKACCGTDASTCPDPGPCRVRACVGNTCQPQSAQDGVNQDGRCPGLQTCCNGACEQCCGSDASSCPDPGPCRFQTCVSDACRPRPLTDGTNPGGRCPGSSVCCGGACAGCCNSDVRTCPPLPASAVCQVSICSGAICDVMNSEDGEPGANCPAPRVCFNGQCVECLEASDCPVAPGECRTPICTAQHACADSTTPDGEATNPPGCTTVCCDGFCCNDGAVCAPIDFTGDGVPDGPLGCCMPEPVEVLCNNRCGQAVDRCGRQFNCVCDEVECLVPICNPLTQNRCDYRPIPDNQPGPGCEDGVCCGVSCCHTACCSGECCPGANDVCHVPAAGGPPTCCTPDDEAVTCQGRCGASVIDNCGRIVTCSSCPSVACKTVMCNQSTGTCEVVGSGPDGGDCTAANGQPGICCGGQCLAGVCCADADCAPSGNDCAGNQCVCGSTGGVCAEPTRGCCGSPGTCTDIDSDWMNCGACGAMCPIDVTCHFPDCVDGTCEQRPIADGIGPGCNTLGSKCCGADCKNLQTDVANCGDCGNVCTVEVFLACREPICAAGFCQTRIVADNSKTLNCGGPDEICCGGVCKNGHRDIRNCGSCGRVCPATADRCVNGTCTCGPNPGQGCAPGQLCCGGVCKNAQTDVNNCGACGRTCAAGQTCQGGVCGHTCENGHCPDSACFLRKWGSTGNGASQFADPEDVAVAANGDVYVLDARNNRVQVFSATGVFKRQWGSQGVGDGQFFDPQGITVAHTPDATVYVTDGQRELVQMFTPDGTFIGKFGIPFRDDRLLDGVFDNPVGIAVAPNGLVYVGDFGLRRVQYFTASGEFRGKFSLNMRPMGMAFAPDGSLVIAIQSPSPEQQDTVDVFTPEGVFVRSLIFTHFSEQHIARVRDVAVAPDGTVFVANRERGLVQYGTLDGQYLGEWGGFGSGDGQFINVWGVAVAPNGVVYTTETANNNRVQAFCVRPRV